MHHAKPLKLDSNLNRLAQALASKFASTDNIVEKDGSYGVNTFSVKGASETEYQFGTASQSWYDEVKDYDFSKGVGS